MCICICVYIFHISQLHIPIISVFICDSVYNHNCVVALLCKQNKHDPFFIINSYTEDRDLYYFLCCYNIVSADAIPGNSEPGFSPLFIWSVYSRDSLELNSVYYMVSDPTSYAHVQLSKIILGLMNLILNAPIMTCSHVQLLSALGLIRKELCSSIVLPILVFVFPADAPCLLF